MGRSPRNPSDQIKGLKKGPWTSEEDQILIDYMHQYGHGVWKLLPKRAGLNRCGKSCRLRWTNYLRPDIKRGNFSPEEEQTIINLHEAHGNKWSMIASSLPGGTDNDIKNFWNTSLRKKLTRSGINPKTHQFIPDPSLLNLAAMIGLIQSMLQILNLNNSWPNFLEGSETLSQFQGPFDGMLLPLQTELPNLEIGGQSRNCHDILETSRMMQQVSGSTDNDECWLPVLVPEGSEVYSGHQANGASSVETENYEQSLVSENGDGRNTAAAMDDEDIGFFWRQIFHESFRASSSGN